jgi:predicted DNA-binding transcriptional regulator AlpA
VGGSRARQRRRRAVRHRARISCLASQRLLAALAGRPTRRSRSGSRSNWDRPKSGKGQAFVAMARAALSEIRPIPRRGLSREEAAMYVGISATKFDAMVLDGRMPKPKRVDGRKVWDVRRLDTFFEALPDDDNVGSSWADA